MRKAVICAVLSAFFASFAAFASDSVNYTLRFPRPEAHLIEVTGTLPVNTPQVELYMAVWTPGSYQLKEYARNVEGFEALDEQGHALPSHKSSKNRWLVEAGAAKALTVRYRVYAFDSSVQGNYVDAGFAMLNGGAIFMTIAGLEQRPYDVTLELPSTWSKSVTPLKRTASHAYAAQGFDELLDSPIYAGKAAVHEFEVQGRKHFLVNEGEGPMWDGEASAKDVKKLVTEYERMMGGLPYDQYVFFNMLIETGGGLEHKNATWMNSSKWAYANNLFPPPSDDDEDAPERGRRRPNRSGWLGLVSHEYFHAWNVKRMRPVELGPFDYQRENYTRSLWLAEGVTSYYGPLAMGRAKLATREQYLQMLSGSIRELQTTPGRLVKPLEENSFDAWIKLYHQDENTVNTAISYYTKGEVVGFVLDARIRKATAGEKSLDDVLRLLYKRYSGEHGYSPEQFRATVSEVAGTDLSGWLRDALETTQELDYREALDWFGLRFKAPKLKPGAAPPLQTGIRVKSEEGRLLVSGVLRGTPGDAAGVNVGDELIAVNGFRLSAAQWPHMLDAFHPGESVKLLVAHRDAIQELAFIVTHENPPTWQLEVRPDATDEQKSHLAAWLRE